MRTPKEVGRLYDTCDWYGWIMCIVGLVFMAYFGGLFKTPPQWWLLAFSLFIFWEYAVRVACGRVYRYVYYDTIIHNLYELKIDDDTFFVAAFDEDSLYEYMDLTYPGMEYTVEQVHVETFIRTEKYL
jgi:hypothetical protein